jgi:hypothetical protein
VAVDHRRQLLPLFNGQDADDFLIERSRKRSFFSGCHRKGLRPFEHLVLVSVVVHELVQPVRRLDQALDALSSSCQTCPIEPLDQISLNVSEPD